MKFRLLLVSIFLGCLQSISATILFVHLGPRIPAYIYVALEQARLFNPDKQVCLIANQHAIDASAYDFSAHTITPVACESLTQTKEHAEFLKKCPHSDAVLDGFWRKAIERFFCLHEYIAMHDLKRVVHLESDVMLYVNIASIQDALDQYSGIGAVFDSDHRCIPSFVYIADKYAIEKLVQFLSKHAGENKSDMAFLAEYKAISVPIDIDNLPLIMPEYIKKNELKNQLGQRVKDSLSYMRHCALFQSIFDGAAIGQYLGGVNSAVHANSRPGFINETCVFNPSQLQIEWRIDEQDRRVPYAIYDRKVYRINNLHIHSKRLHDFRS